MRHAHVSSREASAESAEIAEIFILEVLRSPAWFQDIAGKAHGPVYRDSVLPFLSLIVRHWEKDSNSHVLAIGKFDGVLSETNDSVSIGDKVSRTTIDDGR
jgi:hypothetical protein